MGLVLEQQLGASPDMEALLLMSGFTLLELLLVITIIALLVALQLPMLAKVKFEAQKAECMNYKRQLKIFYYTTDFEDGSPPYTVRPLMKASRLGGKCYNCHASAP